MTTTTTNTTAMMMKTTMTRNPKNAGRGEIQVSDILIGKRKGLFPSLRVRDPFVCLSGLRMMSSVRSFPRQRNRRRSEFLREWKRIAMWLVM